MTLNISKKTMLTILFFITVTGAIILGFTEDTYTLKKLSFDIQSTMLLIAMFFYKEESE